MAKKTTKTTARETNLTHDELMVKAGKTPPVNPDNVLQFATPQPSKGKTKAKPPAATPPEAETPPTPETPEVVTPPEGSVSPPDKAARKAETKRELDLKVATGNLREDEAEQRLVEQEAADAAGDQEDARGSVPATLVDGDTPLPTNEQLIPRDGETGRPIKGACEAFLRFPVMGPALSLRAWAAFYAASMRTVIDVVMSDGTLAERFDGRGATRKPTEPKPAAPNGGGNGNRAARSRGNGAIAQVQALVVKDPAMTLDAITKALADKGITGMNPSTIKMSRSQTLEVLSYLKDKGKKRDKNAKTLGATGTMRRHLVEHPEATVDDLTKALAAANHTDIQAGTISITRASTLAVINLYNANKG